MRRIQVFILRLLFDSDAPQLLHGSIQSVPEGKPHPFTDRQSLLKLLSQMAQSTLENRTNGNNETENEDED